MLVLTRSLNLPLTLYFIVHMDTHRLTFTVPHRPAESTDSVRKSLLPPSATKGTEFREETFEHIIKRHRNAIIYNSIIHLIHEREVA